MDILLSYDEVFFFEESYASGSVSEKICSVLLQRGYKGKVRVNAVKDFIPHNTVQNQLKFAKLDYESMKEIIGE